MTDRVSNLTDATFENEVLNSAQPVLVDVWAPWCGPCRALTPVIEELADELGDSARVTKLNVDENPQTAAKFGITSIPTVLVFADGELKQQLVGVQSKAMYAQAIQYAA